MLRIFDSLGGTLSTLSTSTSTGALITGGVASIVLQMLEQLLNQFKDVLGINDV